MSKYTLCHNSPQVNQKKLKKSCALLAEARAKQVLSLIKDRGFLHLSGHQYKFLRHQYGLGKADIDRSIVLLLEMGKIAITTNSDGLMLEAVA